MDPCKHLIALAERYQIQKPSLPFVEKLRTPFEYQKRAANIMNKPLHKDGSVYLKAAQEDLLNDDFYEAIGFEVNFGSLTRTIATVDALILNRSVTHPLAQEKIQALLEMRVGVFYNDQSEISSHSYIRVEEDDAFKEIQNLEKVDLILLKLNCDRTHYARRFFEYLKQKDIDTPVILETMYELSKDDICVALGAELGSLLCDGLGEGILVDSPCSLKDNRELALNLLQACRLRSSKTEFISCPSCGRTLFDLQSVTQKIQERTEHLPGVKIAIMGCIVNGPGEMADADFGYVGSKAGMIDLYVGKERVEKDIPYAQAVERLVDLLKKHDVWIEPKKLVNAVQ